MEIDSSNDLSRELISMSEVLKAVPLLYSERKSESTSGEATSVSVFWKKFTELIIFQIPGGKDVTKYNKRYKSLNY